MSRTRVRVGRLVGLMVTVATVALAAGSAAGSEPGRASPGAIKRIVGPGDTVWEIARSRVGPEGDPRPLVEAIRTANRLGSGPVHPGQVLLVPLVS